MAFRTAEALGAAEYAAEAQELQRDRQKFLNKQAKAQAKAEKKAQGKSLWSSIGSTLGGIGLPTLLGGLIGGPIGLALATGAGSFLGSKLGVGAHSAQGKGKFGLRGIQGKTGRVKIGDMPLSRGKYHSGKKQMFKSQMDAERDALKEYQDSANELLMQQQIAGALTSGATAGLVKAGLGGTDATKALDTLQETIDNTSIPGFTGTTSQGGVGLQPWWNQGN